MTSYAYPLGVSAFISGDIDWDADTLKLAILTSSYTPATTHQYFSDVSANQVTGTGYTAGGTAVSSKTNTVTQANSWGTSRANTTAYALGDVVRPATGNGYLYEAVAAGTSGGSIPTYPTVVGQTVTDGTVTWVCRGKAVIALDFADVTWATSTITGRTVVLYKDTGTGSTSRLIGYESAGSDVVSSAGNWTYQVPTAGFLLFFAE